MMIEVMDILQFPNVNLRKKAKKVTEFNKDLKILSDRMFATMYHANGVGLAATQIDVHMQIFVIDLQDKDKASNVSGEVEDNNLKSINDDENTSKLISVNPKIEVLDTEKVSYKEGCLSISNGVFQEEVSRPKKIRLDAQDIEGNNFSIEAEGLLAVCIQHEYDHLQGKLFIDLLPVTKKEKIISDILNNDN